MYKKLITFYGLVRVRCNIVWPLQIEIQFARFKPTILGYNKIIILLH